MGKYLLILTGLLFLVGLFVPKLSSLICIKTTGEEGWFSFMLPFAVYILFFLIWIFSAIFLFVINRRKTKEVSEEKPTSPYVIIIGLIIIILVVFILGSTLFGFKLF